MIKLHQALGITSGDVVSFIGAGGKTALLLALGYELVGMGLRVLATSTVSKQFQELEVFPNVHRISGDSAEISAALNKMPFVYLYQGVHRGQVSPVSAETIHRLLDTVDSDVLLVESDVSNGKPIKAPYTFEPMIPEQTTLVVHVASLSALGKPFNDENVYNTEAIINRYGFATDARIKTAWMAQIVRDDLLGMQGVPKAVRVVSFLNQTPSRGYGRGRARMVARMILRNPQIHSVVLGAARSEKTVHEVQRPVGAIVLAAGLSTRMGNTKVLLPWAEGRTILEHIIDQLIKSRVDKIIVVTGHQAREIKALLKPLDVEVVYNKHYKTGEMLSSIKTGLAAMPENIAAGLIVLGDQPRIQPKIVYQVLTHYAETGGELVVPSYQRQRGHPILVSRRYWNEILNLPHHGTLRDVLEAHKDAIEYVDVDNDSVLHDVDTPQDYDNERWRAGLSGLGG